MPRIALVTDSNAQLPPVLAERFGVSIVALTVTIDSQSFREGIDLDADGFFSRFQPGTTVTTSQPSPGEFLRVYADCAAAGATELVSIHIGSAVSGTCNSARLAAAEIDLPVTIVDTGTASFAVACCVWEAGLALERGASAAEAAAIAQAVAATCANVFVVKALDLVRRGGRLGVVGQSDSGPGSSNATGETGVPVLSLVGGVMESIGSVRDFSEAATAMADHIIASGRGLRVGVGVADTKAAPLWLALEERLRTSNNVIDMVRYRIGPSVAAHTGPGTAGACWYPTLPGAGQTQ